MDPRRFDDATRFAASLPRRRSLLLGGAALTAALASGSIARADKKSKKKCKRQKKQCRNLIRNVCNGSMEEDACLDALLPCCASCNVKAAVGCTVNAFSTT